MRKLIFLIALIWAWSSIRAQSFSADIADERILSFETSSLPLAVSDQGRLTLSDEHYKHGRRSARWEWTKPHAQLRIAAPVGYLSENPNPLETSVATFVFWVYAPQALDGSLRFEFRKQGRLCAWFDYGLRFAGWRGAWVAFDRDMQGRPEEGMDEVIIKVQGAQQGVLCFDHLILSSFQDVRHHTADFQAPFINTHTQNHWLVLLRSWRNPLPTSAALLAPSEQKQMLQVEERLRELLLEGRKPQTTEELRGTFADYGIVENPDGTIKGKPVWFTRYAETYMTMGHGDVVARYAKNRQLLRGCNDFMFELAVAYNRSKSLSEREELARMYVLMTRHLLDQGFAAGSAQGTLHHLGYSMRNFYTGPVLMREVLRRAGLETTIQQAMEWFSGVGEVKLPQAAPGMDIDAFNTSLIGRLASLVMMPDTPEKATWFGCFSNWVDNGFRYAPGLASCFKSDGTVFHHRRHYPAYAVDGFDGAVKVVWLLRGTDFRVSAESHSNLKRALLEMRYYCNLRSFPLALSGRHPDGKGKLIARHYARLAQAGTPDGREGIDSQMAAAYLRIAEKQTPQARKFRAQGIVEESSPQGCRVYGYNASLSHRRDGWLLTAAGHSRYLWSAEIYRRENHYGRYLTHGSLQLLGDGDPVDALGSGFHQAGWDWCHIPGTTAVERPMAQMKADIRNVDTFSGYEEMLLSDEGFVGGVSHKGRDGVFSMKLHENDKYNGSLRARKSFFFFDNRVVALGSGIENSAEGGVHTTLFQNWLDDRSSPIEVNGSAVATFPYRATLDKGGILRDNLRNAYFVANGRVCVARERQHSLDEHTDAPTEGDFTKAYIDHGGVIRGGGYEYLMVVHASDAQVAACARALPYEVLRRDSVAHIVVDKPSGTTAYALFEGGEVGEGPLVRVSLPVLVMMSGGEELTVSVCDPDLRLYEGAADQIEGPDGRWVERSIYSRAWIDEPSRPSEVQVVVRGGWKPAETTSDCRTESEGENTVLIFTCREGATREVKLLKK